MTYSGHHVTLTWGQILTLMFHGHAIRVSMHLDEANTMVSKSLLYHFKHGSYHRNTVSLKNAVFDLSWPLTPKPLVLGEIWRRLSERAFQELSIAFLNFDVLKLNFDDVILEFWPLETPILTWGKKWPKWFRNDFPLAFERCLSFFSMATRSRDHGGGGGGPAGRGLIYKHGLESAHDSSKNHWLKSRLDCLA